jgi:DNA-binding IclR family transcriptional regulator
MIAKKTYEVRSVSRALDIFEFLLRRRQASLMEISEELGINKSTAYGLIKTLTPRGYLRNVKTSRNKYALGLKLIELGNKAASELDIRSESTPILHELAEKTNQTCHLAILDGIDGVYLLKVEGDQHIHLDSWEGKRCPLHSSGVGKALLAWQNEEKINQLLNVKLLERRTERTIIDPNRIKEHLSKVRMQGWALDDQENEKYVRCIGVPVLDIEGRPIAAISISGLVDQLSDEALLGFVPLAKEAAHKISIQMGRRL